MTEKRFKLDSEVGFIDTQCGGDSMTLFEVVVELNKLNEENEDLKQNCKNYEWYKQYKAVLNENEELKKLLECSRQEANDYCEELMGKDEFIRLYKRINKELEQEIQQIKTKIRKGGILK